MRTRPPCTTFVALIWQHGQHKQATVSTNEASSGFVSPISSANGNEDICCPIYSSTSSAGSSSSSALLLLFAFAVYIVYSVTRVSQLKIYQVCSERVVKLQQWKWHRDQDHLPIIIVIIKVVGSRYDAPDMRHEQNQYK